MKIVDLIRRDMVVPALAATDKRGILEELATYMAGHHPRIDRAALSRVLIEREQLASTAIGEGVAIPHGKLPTVTEIVACLGRVPAGVDFDSIDGRAPEGAGPHQPRLQGRRVPQAPARGARLRVDVPRHQRRGRQVLMTPV